jgi:hypothetical protein
VKLIKTTPLVALAALMATALIGASSASAGNTQLCTVDENPCGSGHAVTHIHDETLEGSLAVILNSLGNVKTEALFLSLSVGSLGSPQDITGHFTFSHSTRKKLIGEENCTVSEIAGTATLFRVLRTGNETASVIGEFEMRVVCGSIIDCTYDGQGLEGTAKGALSSTEPNGEIVLSKQVMHKVSGSLCPESAELDFLDTPLPNPVYISE